MITRQRLGLAIMLFVISTRLQPGELGTEWNYVLTAVLSMGGALFVTPYRE